MSTPYRRDLQRLRYWQGQTLRSIDARDQDRFDALRRQLHNRALHSTAGLAFGLAVKVADDDRRAVEVACGLAYDSRGRELILQRARRIAAPQGPNGLVLRLRESSGPSRASACCAPVDAGCSSADAHLLEQDVELAWVPFSSFEPADGVMLALFVDGALDEGFTPKQARPIARPRLARGETVKGDTPWEPWVVERADGKGGIVSQVVGVQTHIDTSASGFTQTPRYVANLQTQAWDLSSAEFAPAFFPHVADPAADGFTFRLLMTEIGRRRFSAWRGLGRVASIARAIGDRLLVEVDPLAAFKVGDVVAQLRPRAASVVRIDTADGNKLTLSAKLPLEAGVTTLAVANLPRMASVLDVLPEDPAVLAAFTATLPVKKGDVLQRTADGALAVVDRVSQGKLTVGKPFAGWKTTDTLMVARMAGAAQVKSAAVSADGTSLVMELRPVAHGVELGMSLVLLDGEKLPLASTPKVTSHSGATIEVQPVPPAAEMAGLARVAPLAAGIAIQSLQPKNRSTVGLDTVGPFDAGDFVAAADDPSKVALVEHVNKGKKQLELSAALAVKAGSVIVGVNWQTATTIDVFDPKLPNRVTVGRARAALSGDFVALRSADEFAMPVPVASVADKTLTLSGPLVGATRLDTLAVGRVPRIATVVSQAPDEARVVIAQAGALNVGDCVMRLPAAGAAGGEAAVVQVVEVSGAQIVLAQSPGPLVPGDRLSTVHWRDGVRVERVDAAQPTHIEVDGEVDFREGDVVGVVTHHADCSNPGYVEKIDGNLLTLLPGLEQGDGIVDRGWIDGGIVGPAAVSYLSPTQLSFPSDWQPVVRMDTLDGLDGRSPATAYGLDLLTGQYQSRSVLPLILDPVGGHLIFFFQGTEAYRFRPETLSVITRFNTDFPRAFATFAQKQQLVVRWIGCQQEFPPASGCPAQAPYDPCALAAAPATASEDS
jgi:hypothetical protein